MTHIAELPFTENNLAAVMLALAVKEGHAPAIAFSKGQEIPRNQTPPPTNPVKTVSGKQLVVLSAIMDKPKTRKAIAEAAVMYPNSVSNALKALSNRGLVRIVRKVKRHGSGGSPVSVYGPTEAGRKSVEAVDDV